MTSTTTTPTAIAVPEAPDSAIGRLRWLVADTVTLTIRGINHWIRQPLTVLGGLAFMIMLVALYGFLFGGAMQVPGGGNYMEFLLPGMFVMDGCSRRLPFLPYAAARPRHLPAGWRRQRRWWSGES